MEFGGTGTVHVFNSRLKLERDPITVPERYTLLGTSAGTWLWYLQ